MLAGLIRKFGAALAAVMVTASLSSPVAAQTAAYCGQRDALVKYLNAQYQEGQRGLGFVDQTLIFELFVGPSGSWTLLATHANGVSCLVSSGDDWQDIANPPPEPAANADPARYAVPPTR